MRMMMVTAALALVACGSGSDDGPGGAGGSGGGSDGRLRPPPNGVRISEAEACNTLRKAYEERALELGCTKTARACLGFIRVIPGHDPDCVEYDQGSVQGCAAHHRGAASCDALVDDSCVATVYPGSEPAGCP